MGDHRNARGPEARIGFGAGDLLGEFRREGPVHGRGVRAHLFEHAPAQHRHPPAAAGRAGMIRAGPRRQFETAGFAGLFRKRPGAFPLQLLDHPDQAHLQRFEPGAGRRLAIFQRRGGIHLGSGGFLARGGKIRACDNLA